DNVYGDRAAAIAGRFAQVFPDYAVRFDHPSRPVIFYPADQKWPYEGMAPYNGAKWRWWGYDDIPTYLANVYDLLMSGYDWRRMDRWIGQETEKRIARDLLRLGYEFTTANPELYTNKSPGMYAEMIRVGRILGDPLMVHEAVKRFREFFAKGFFADGWWMEGSPAYHDQTIILLQRVVKAIEGYVDPPYWKGERLDYFNIAGESSLFRRALKVSQEAVLPNGRKIPINDTEWDAFGDATDTTISRLWPVLGNAVLGTGSGGNQTMLNVNWSGNYGHSHYDNGSIILYASGQELLSDLGYTHTKYRGWTISTTSHNTVVIDQKNQEYGSVEKPVTGRLLFYDDKDAHVKVVDVDASPAYSAAEIYRRRLVMVHAGPGRDYVVDRFDVKGGKTHDWFLHGMCEQEGKLETSVVLSNPIETLVPEWAGKEKPQTQYDTDPRRFHPYSFLRKIKTGTAVSQWTATWRYEGCGLRSHVFSEPETEVFCFQSPSVRLAKEDDNKLEDYFRNGLMQRHVGESSTFIAVHEPFRNQTWIRSVGVEDGTIIVRYEVGRTIVEDRIKFDDGNTELTVTSTGGWKYESGRSFTGRVESLKKWQGKRIFG
ncbi:MAG: heparinase II/III family protein, partial [Chitinophagaceae bacterium]|nr:heparinase II/III family protein [Chitinophagaceae bacterium]